MRIYEGKVCPPSDGKIAIIVSRFNKTITEHMLEGALEKLRQNSVDDDNITIVWVPGAFELPTLAQRFAEDENYQAVICLGCVIKGETTHDQHINRAVSLEIARIGAEFGIPVIFGLLTCNTAEQALARSGLKEQSHDKIVDPTVGNKGAEAAETALEMIDLLLQLPELPVEEPPQSFVTHAEQYHRGDFEVDSDLAYFDDDQDFEESNDDDNWFQHGHSSERQHKSRTSDVKRPKDRHTSPKQSLKNGKDRHHFKDSRSSKSFHSGSERNRSGKSKHSPNKKSR